MSRFYLEFFCLTVSKNSVGESFTNALFSDIEKVWIRAGGGGVSRFSVENFLSPRVEKFRRRILYCFIILGYRKCLDRSGGRGSFKIFRRNFFVSQHLKTS